METKQWYQSKIVWMNAILSLMGIGTLVADTLDKTPALAVPGVIMLVVGCLGIVVRIWFTDTNIQTVQRNNAKAAKAARQ